MEPPPAQPVVLAAAHFSSYIAQLANKTRRPGIIIITSVVFLADGAHPTNYANWPHLMDSNGLAAGYKSSGSDWPNQCGRNQSLAGLRAMS